MTVTAVPADGGRKSPSSPTSESAHHPEKTEQVTNVDASRLSDDNTSQNEPKPHLHAKTYLAVFAVCAIYFVQIYNVVGTGAVSPQITYLHILPNPPTNTIHHSKQTP